MRCRAVYFVAFISCACILAPPAAAQTAPAAAAQPAAPLLPSGPAYRIHPGDELEIFVWGEERLQRVVRVLPDGTFSFPLVGQVLAANRLPGDIERVISQGLQPQYSGAVPQVTVSVRSPTGLQFSVIGKVRGPGTFTPGRYINALEALSIAGGPTEFANVSDIVIIRKTGSGLTTVRTRLSEALRGQLSQSALAQGGIPQIMSGDTLVVP